MSEQSGKAIHDQREEVLREELERRLVFLEDSDESTFGEFTAVDWLLCTLLFFALPIFVLVLLAP